MLALNKNDILQWEDSVRTVGIWTHIIYFPTMGLNTDCLDGHCWYWNLSFYNSYTVCSLEHRAKEMNL